MTQHYSDPSREHETYSLPDIEVFYSDGIGDHGDEKLEPGWYWWACFPGCLPDSNPNGPFKTEEEALEDARNY